MEFISNNQWIVILFPFLIIVIIGLVLGIKNVRREKGVRLTAEKLGFLFSKKKNIKGIQNAPAFFLLRPQSRYVRFLQLRNIIEGKIGNYDFVLFDYVSTYSKRRSNVETVLAMSLQGADCPDFRLVPVNKVTVIQKFVIHQTVKRLPKLTSNKINFKDEPRFSEKYFLYSSDEQAVRKLFNASVLDSLSKSFYNSWNIVSEKGWMNLYQKNKTVKPEFLQDFLNEAKLIYETILNK